MSSIFGVMGIVSLIVGFFAASVTFYSIKEGDRAMAFKAGLVLAVCVFFYAVAPSGKPHFTNDCESWGRFATTC